MKTTLPVADIFLAYQGEGPHAGRRCSFLRLGLCNLHCAWCDTPYTWDRERFDVAAECPDREPDAILAELGQHGTATLVLTGGEPLVHGATHALRDLLMAWSGFVHVETNGTRIPPPWMQARVAHWSVSPKLHPQGDPQGRRMPAEPMAFWTRMEHAIWKVVCRDEAEVRVAAELAAQWGLPLERLWIMPEGSGPFQLLTRARWIEQAALDVGANFTLRQQVILHGNTRGT